MWQYILDNQKVFFIALSVIIPVLSIAVFFQGKIFFKQKKVDLEEQNKKRERQGSLKESIRIISMATIQGQCETSEACLRLANLLPLYEEVDPKEDQWQDLFSMFQEIRGLKTMSERADLKTQARHKEDQIRYAAEEKYHKRILEVCQRLYDITRSDS